MEKIVSFTWRNCVIRGKKRGSWAREREREGEETQESVTCCMSHFDVYFHVCNSFIAADGRPKAYYLCATTDAIAWKRLWIFIWPWRTSSQLADRDTCNTSTNPFLSVIHIEDWIQVGWHIYELSNDDPSGVLVPVQRRRRFTCSVIASIASNLLFCITILH